MMTKKVLLKIATSETVFMAFILFSLIKHNCNWLGEKCKVNVIINRTETNNKIPRKKGHGHFGVINNIM